MTRIGGGTHESEVGLVVGSAELNPAAQPHPVDATTALHRMRSAEIDRQWHALLDGVYTACLVPASS